ncbi:MAG: 16S rRNA (cytosine(1402)-N(4))-methyltransferase RsmH, partial [Alphaproteobacteria bacterium]|nr:16S rRNA (cytosine(1402)-N(4))-methyltransferase RsmH [Alphaproteobacteria bacterium]
MTDRPDPRAPAAPADEGRHRPVLLEEVLAALAPADGATFVDATFGRGGYARALLEAAACRVDGIDCDPEAVAAGRALEARYPGRFAMHRGHFGDMDALVPGPVDGVALDLGVSSPQLDNPERGFSFRADGPLDMRMSGEGPTAADVVNTLPEAELARILFELGEERQSRRVARALVAARQQAPVTRTAALADLVRREVRRSKDGIDPATRTFQALRIYVNDELGELDRGLSAAERCLRPGGRLAVVSFHSLEDRRVKRFLADRSAPAEGGGRGVSRHRPVAET